MSKNSRPTLVHELAVFSLLNEALVDSLTRILTVVLVFCSFKSTEPHHCHHVVFVQVLGFFFLLDNLLSRSLLGGLSFARIFLFSLVVALDLLLIGSCPSLFFLQGYHLLSTQRLRNYSTKLVIVPFLTWTTPSGTSSSPVTTVTSISRVMVIALPWCFTVAVIWYWRPISAPMVIMRRPPLSCSLVIRRRPAAMAPTWRRLVVIRLSAMIVATHFYIYF